MEKQEPLINEDLKLMLKKNNDRYIKDLETKIEKLDKGKILDLIDYAIYSIELSHSKSGERLSESLFNEDNEVIGESRYGKYKKIRNNIVSNKELIKLLDNKTFDNFITDLPFRKTLKDRVLKYCNNQDYTQDIKGNLMLIGSSGYGKTHLASAVCREFVLHGRRIKYVEWLNEVDKIKYARFEDRENIFKPLYNADVLYIDDFLMSGSDTKPSESDVNIALRIIDSRVKNDMQTIITTNRTLDELYDISDLLGGRIQELFSKENIIMIPYVENGNFRRSM